VSVVDDLFALWRDTPRLVGARCKGRTEWDSYEDPELVEYAQSQCASCPAKPECERWYLQLRPSQRSLGVTAGRLNKPRPPRKRKAAA
jgi:hypothetical protein